MKENWTYKKLGEVAESDLGKTLNQSKDKGELYSYLCAINIQWDKIDMSNLKQTRFENNELERYSVVKGDLLVCEGGDVGRAAIWNEDYPIQYQNALHRVRFNGEVFNRFCLYYLFFLKQIGAIDTKYAKGVTIKHLVKSSLLSIPIPIPPMEEQERIVAELDLLQSVIDKKKAQLDEYDKLAQSIFYEMFGDPIDNPKKWEVKKLEEVVSHDCPISYGIVQPGEEVENGVPVVRPVDLVNTWVYREGLKVVEKGISEAYKRTVLKGNELLFCVRGTTGAVSFASDELIGCNVTRGITPLSFDEHADKYYMFYLLKTDGLQAIIFENTRGIALKQINMKDVRLLPVPLPPLSLQQSFAEKIEAIEHQKELVKQSLNEVKTLFDSRMDYYFN